jgi:uncharacterized protein (TIRG00374 family)
VSPAFPASTGGETVSTTNAGSAMPEAGQRTSPRSILPWIAVGGLISAAAIVLATRGIDLPEVADAIGSASPLALAAGTLLILCSYPLLAIRWRSIAAEVGPPGPGRMLEIVLIGAAVNNALPARLGEVARSVGLSRSSSRPVLESFGTVIVDRVADVVFFAAVFGLTVGASPTPGWVRWIGVGGAILTVALVGALGATAAVMSRRRGPAPTGRLTRHLVSLGEGLRCVRTWGGVVRALVLTAAAWGVWMGGAWFVAESIGIRLSLPEVLFTTGLLGLGSAVPSAPGFIGTYHWIAASAVGLFGVGGADALAFAVLLHAAWFIPTTIAGSILMVRWGLGFAALRRISMTTPAVGT